MNFTSPLRSALEKKWENRYEVLTDNPIQDIWNTFENITSTRYCEEILLSRLKKVKSNDELIQTDKFQFLEDYEISKVIPEVKNIIYQAKDIYFACRNLSLLSKPILLFYAFEKLVQLLYVITYKPKEEKYYHSISYDKNADKTRCIQVKKEGLLPNLLHSISKDDYYLQEPHFEFNDIINCGPINYIKTQSYNRLILLYELPNKNTKSNKLTVKINECIREFIFIYALSILCRYHVNLWTNIISGQNSEEFLQTKIMIIRTFINTTEINFPNLILNEIYRKEIDFFYPSLLMEHGLDEYNDSKLWS
jgi:hypothetical protein